MKKSFGARLRTLRQLANLTQLELAELVGLSDRYLGRMERGLVSPSFESIEKLARALKIRPANLFLFSHGPPALEDAPGAPNNLVNMSRIGSFLYPGPDKPCWISPAILSMLGLPPSAARGFGRDSLLGHVEPEDLPQAEAFLDSVFELRAHPPASIRIRRRDGQSRQLLVVAETAASEGDVSVSGTVVDATDQCRFEELLATSRQSLELLVRDRTAHLAGAVAKLEGEVDLRSRTQRSLRQSEREKASIMSSLDGVMIKRLTPDMRVIWANDAMEKLCGKHVSSLAGRICHVAAMNSPTPCPGCPVRDALASSRAEDGELTTPDGRNWIARATPVTDEAGNVESVIFMGFDVTERLKARLALEDATRERDALLQSISGLTIKYMDRDMRTVWASTCDPESPVARGENYVGLTCYKAFQKRDTPCPGCLLVETLENGEPHEGEHKAPNGKTFIVRCNPVRDQRGKIKGAIHMAFDITERKRVEQSLVKARMFLEHLLNSCAAVLYTCKPHGDFAVTFMSDNAMAVFGHPAEAFVGHPEYWSANLYPGEEERLFAQLGKLFETGRLEHEYRFRHGNGSWRWTRTDIRLIRDARGEPQEIVGSWIDITETKACELTLRESESRYRNLFLSNSTVQLIIDVETGAILDANPAALNFYGYGLGELKRLNISDINILPPDELNVELTNAGEGRQSLFRFKHRLASGEVRDVESRVSILTQGGRLVSHSLIIDLGDRPGA